jgi:hypothetical protein
MTTPDASVKTDTAEQRELLPAQNFYDQQPFQEVIEGIAQDFVIDIRIIREILTSIVFITHENFDQPDSIPEEIDSSGCRTRFFKQQQYRGFYNFARDIIKLIPREKFFNISLELLTRLDQFPLWMNYIYRYTSKRSPYTKTGERKSWGRRVSVPTYGEWLVETEQKKIAHDHLVNIIDIHQPQR